MGVNVIVNQIDKFFRLLYQVDEETEGIIDLALEKDVLFYFSL